jgi:hypothetical protein
MIVIGISWPVKIILNICRHTCSGTDIFQINHSCRFEKTERECSLSLSLSCCFKVVPPGIEPGTHGFSVHCSTD